MKKVLCLVCAFALISVGCGDDDTGAEDSGTDTGAMLDTAAPDTSRPDTSSPDTGEEDTSVPDTAEPPTEECDPFDSETCEEGKCSLALEFDTEGMFVDAFFACVDDSVARDPGVPCTRGVDVTPEDETDNIVADDCQAGFFCNQSADGLLRCEALCDTGEECGDGEYCGGFADGAGICTTPANCDPVYQVGCEGEEVCYTIENTSGDLTSDCFDFVAPDGGSGAAGEECMFINNCMAGTRCTPMDTTGDGELDTATCVPFCLIGDPPDPLPDSELDGSCDMTCDPFELESDDNVVLTPSTPGLCVAG